MIETLFVRESARLTGVLTRILGVHNVELAEDVVQEAFLAASRAWSEGGVPDNPSAWLLRTARNRAIDIIRRERTRRHFADDLTAMLDSDLTLDFAVDAAFEEDRIQDDTLTMIFLCCGVDASPDQRITLILKTLCGLSVAASARALLTSEATIKKRLVRVRKALQGKSFALPSEDEIPAALRTAHMALYLLFNEGYLSTSGEPIQRELCRQAMFLTRHLTMQPSHSDASTHALMALMCLHTARMDARLDAEGSLVPIDLQDRTTWDRGLLAAGFHSLRRARAMDSTESTRYLIEAAIAANHCVATSFADTNWSSICALYDRLMHVRGSPIAALNRAIAISYRDGPAAGIAAVDALQLAAVGAQGGREAAVLAHLHARAGDATLAGQYRDEAMRAATTEAERRLLDRQVSRALEGAG